METSKFKDKSISVKHHYVEPNYSVTLFPMCCTVKRNNIKILSGGVGCINHMLYFLH